MLNKVKSKFIVMTVAFAVFLATFNETFLNVAFEKIGADLGVGFSSVQWLATGYMLGAAIMIPVSAFMYRKIPTKTLFLVTLLFLIGGSVVGIVSQDFTTLIIGRVIQAIGSGMLIPIAMNITLEVAPREKLGTYMGLMGAMTTLGPSLSIITSGFLLSVGDWHLLFWLFGGLCLLCFVIGALFIGNIATLTKPKLDILSVALISIALVGILYAISNVFNMWVVALITFVVGCLALLIFIKRQNKIAEPLINLEPLKVKPFAIGVIINMLALIIVFAMNILIPQYLQAFLGAKPLDASITLFPAILLSCILAPVAGKIYDKYGIKVLLPLGFLLMAIFVVIISLCINSSYILLACIYVPVEIGSALIIVPVQSYALSFLKREQNPHGVTIMSTGFQIAGCIGASLFASIYTKSLNLTAHSTAFLIVGLLGALCGLIGLILSLLLNRYKRNKVVEEKKIASLKDIMMTDVFTIDANASVIDAMQLFVTKRISGAPVMLDGELFGFISDGDIIRYLSKNHSNIKNVYTYSVVDGSNNLMNYKIDELSKLSVKDIATKDILTVKLNEELDEICRIITNGHVKKVPVINEGKMVGIVNRSDVTKYVMGVCLTLNNK